MAFFRSLLFALCFYPGSLVAVLASFVIAALGGPAAMRAHAVNWARFYLLCARYLLGIRLRIEGEIPDGPHLYAVKHQSMYETLAMIVILHQPAVVVKRELADMPLWGRCARKYGVIPVDRSGSAAALREMMQAARAALAAGRSVVIYPEGTRVPPGEQPCLRAGFAGLYKALALPVVPVAVDSGRLVPRGFLKHPGAITIRFGKAVPARLPRAEIEAHTHAAINALEPAMPAMTGKALAL